MNEEIFLNNLSNIFDKNDICTDYEHKEKYRNDWSTSFESNPIAIVFPKEIEQVVNVTKVCNEFSYPMIGSGGRTGLSGGASALSNELIISFDKMNKIIDFDETTQTVLCQPGLITANLQSFADEKELYYPVDFSSVGSSQIGGNIATNAGGIRVLKYGTTSKYVYGINVVTGNGKSISMDNMLVKNATGPDLKNFFIASEGIYGLTTSCRMKLIQKPRETTVALLGFNNISSLDKIMRSILSLDIEAAEFFTNSSLSQVNSEFKNVKIDHLNNSYYMIVEYCEDNTFSNELEKLYKLKSLDDVFISSNRAQKDSIWDYRMLISESISRKSPIKFDIAVPLKNVSKLIFELESFVSNNDEFNLVLFGHVGDGNLHVNILKNKQNSSKYIDELESKVHSIVLGLDGTLSAEHGIGANKLNVFMSYENNIKLELLKNLKDHFDPKWILNPGKLIGK